MPRRWRRHSATIWSAAWTRPRRCIGSSMRRSVTRRRCRRAACRSTSSSAGPPALARRLAQIGVAEPAVAAGLQTKLLQGQRLVSKDGGLWRWDGFVRLPDAAGPGATRLRQRARLRQLEAEVRRAGARRWRPGAGAGREPRRRRASARRARAGGGRRRAPRRRARGGARCCDPGARGRCRARRRAGSAGRGDCSRRAGAERDREPDGTRPWRRS